MIAATKQAALEHAIEESPRESCGLVVLRGGEELYVRCRNVASQIETFVIHPEDYAAAEDLGDVLAIVHSHPNASSLPSQADRVSCEATGLPWYIVSVPDGVWSELRPSGYRAPLVGREFSYGVLDCWTLIRDWFREERGIALGEVESDYGWWKRGENLYLENFPRLGFREIKLEELAAGDVLLMRIRSLVVNHGAVYLGNDRILHHVEGRLSSRDVWGGYWRKSTALAIRYFGGASC